MQLNNKNTHGIIVIDSVNTDRVLFQKYANDLRNGSNLIESVVFIIDKKQPTGTATIAQFELQKAYEHLLTLPEFADYEISIDKNWKFADNTIRLIVDKKKLTPHLLAADAVGQLVSYVLADANIKQHTIDQPTEEFIYIYLNFLLTEHEAIIAASDCIVIDNL